jgi:hypothetical protein
MKSFLYERIAMAATAWEVDVWLDLPPEVAELRLPRAIALLEPEGNGTRLRCSWTVLEDLAVMLLGVGCDIDIRNPPELANAFRAIANRALALAEGARHLGPGVAR